MQLDSDFIRAQFPAFSEPALSGRAFFENAGGSYPCAPVVERLTRFYRERKVQPYGPYEASRLAGEEMDEARRRLAAMLNVATEELSFGPSTTANTYVLAQAFRQAMKPGEAIVVTDQDHEANSGPWRRLAGDGIEVREWRMDPETGHLDPADLARLLDGDVRLVCFPHCSNVVGEVNDVAAICRMVHDAGAVACVDGVSYAPHGLPDVEALGADIYLFSAYKTYGPHQGLMTITRELGERLPEQGHFFNADTLCKRFTPAGRIMRRWRPRRGWRTISTLSTPAICPNTPNRRNGRVRCTTCSARTRRGSCSRCSIISRPGMPSVCWVRARPGTARRPWRWS